MVTASRPHLAFVQSCWHQDIVDRAKLGFVDRIGEQAHIEFFELPGAFELPLHARTLADTGRFDAVVAAGFVVDGGIYRHEFVGHAVIDGLMRVQLDTHVPVFSCVLTPQQFEEGVPDSESHRFFFDHMVVKGREAADACLRTLEARALVGAS